MAENDTERLSSTLARPPIHGGNDPVDPHHPVTPDPVPPFQPARYTFRLLSVDCVLSRSRNADTDVVSFSVGVGNANPLKASKNLGDIDSETVPVGLSLGPIQISDPNAGIAMNYIVLNSGHRNPSDVEKLLTDLGSDLAKKGAATAAATVGAAIGIQVGSAMMPVIGSALGLLAGWIVGEAAGIITADCDGPVAVEQAAFKGQQLWNFTAHGPHQVTTYHPGTDSPSGCGSNSAYRVTWVVTRS